MHLLGIDWVGINAENGRKLLLSIGFVAVALVVSRLLRVLIGMAARRSDHALLQVKFWSRQGVSLLAAVVLILGLLSIWFDDPARLASAFGLVSAGLAFALQQVVTSVAGGVGEHCDGRMAALGLEGNWLLCRSWVEI